jgi:hypothetical protein
MDNAERLRDRYLELSREMKELASQIAERKAIKADRQARSPQR